MIIFTIDDEQLALEHLTETVKRCATDAAVFSFDNAQAALQAARETPPDVVFSDIKMRTESGMDLAWYLTRLHPKVNIIFTTGFRDYMEPALEMHVSGYILKPVTADKVRHELSNLRYPVAADAPCRLRVRTFGAFAAFLGSETIQFHLTKTWELFALLIDQNGHLCATNRLAEYLWEDGSGLKQHGSYFQNILSDLQQTLKKAGCADVLLRRRGMIGIDKTKLDCDYYDFLAGKPEAIRAFGGEYMRQYSWGEETLALLTRTAEDLQAQTGTGNDYS